MSQPCATYGIFDEAGRLHRMTSKSRRDVLKALARRVIATTGAERVVVATVTHRVLRRDGETLDAWTPKRLVLTVRRAEVADACPEA